MSSSRGVIPAFDKSAAAKPRWPLWKKLTVAAIVIVIVIALAVGLGVGLHKHHDDDQSGNDDSSSTKTPAKSRSLPNASKLWQPAVGTRWQIILKNPLDLGDDYSTKSLTPKDALVWDLDVFDNDKETFGALKKAGHKVICYFSAGSYENWRPDKNLFHKSDLGHDLDGWAGERWLNLSSTNVRNIMKKRIKMAADKGCDAIDPDNVDGYSNVNGLHLTKADSIDYVKFLATEAAKLNMATGLKNAGDIIPNVLNYVHFSVNEQCIQYGECETFAPFIAAKKPVFNIEYPSSAPKVKASTREAICSHKGNAAHSEHFSTVIKDMDLTGWVLYCDGETAKTKTQS